jgi:hypothetical protein
MGINMHVIHMTLHENKLVSIILKPNESDRHSAVFESKFCDPVKWGNVQEGDTRRLRDMGRN